MSLRRRRENLPKKVDMEPTFEVVVDLFSNDENNWLKATTHCRELLSGRNPPIERVIEIGLVPRFVKYLGRDDYPQLQIDHGAIPVFVRLLTSASVGVCQQAMWALGNVAGDSLKLRDLVLEHGALKPLAQFNEHAEIPMLRIVTWTLLNLCRGLPQPDFEQTKPALPALAKLVTSDDKEVLSNACRAIYCLSDGTNDRIQANIDSGVCGRLVELLYHPSASVLIPALRTVHNILSGDDTQKQVIIQHQALVCLSNLLTNNQMKEVKMEACRMISCITANTNKWTHAVIDAGMISPLVQLLGNAEFEIKEAASISVSNAISGATHEQIKFLVSQGCIKPLCDLLNCPDPETISAILEGLENILMVGEAEKKLGHTGGVNVYAQLIDEAEGLEKIEILQSHDNNQICKEAVRLRETYWLEDDDELLQWISNSIRWLFSFS